MNRFPMSKAAAAVLRALLKRVGDGSDRILLTDVRSVEGQSLTFSGERHRFEFRLIGPDREILAGRLVDGIDDFEFAIPGQIVADVDVTKPFAERPQASATLTIEALTIEE